MKNTDVYCVNISSREMLLLLDALEALQDWTALKALENQTSDEVKQIRCQDLHDRLTDIFEERVWE